MAATDHISDSEAGSSEGAWDALRKQVAETGWPITPLGMTTTDALVTDANVLSVLEAAEITGGTEVLLDGHFSDDEMATRARVFVLLSRGERRRVLQLQGQFPDKTVISVTYGNSASTADLRTSFAGREVSLLVGLPCCGLDYLSRLMTVNNLATVVDVFDELAAVWSACASDFEPARYALAKIGDIDLSASKGRLGLRLDLDLFERWRIEGALSPRKLRFLVMRADARVVYMQRRNKAEQAIAAMPSAASAGRHCLTTVELPAEAPSISDIQHKVLQFIAIETRFEMLLGALPTVRMLTFEEATDNPVEIVKMLVNFFEAPGLKKVRVFDSKPYQLRAEWLAAFQQEFKSAMMQYLGLEKNEHGSLALRAGLVVKH